MDELLAQFLIEAPELVQQGGDALMALEHAPGDRARLDDAFRAIHTLKGSVGLFDLPALAMVLHAAEDRLGAIRSGGERADRAGIDALLAVLNQTERWLGALEAGGLPPDADETARRLKERLRAAPTSVSGDAPDTDIAAPQAGLQAGAAPAWARELRRAWAPATGAVGTMTAVRYTPVDDAYFSGDDPVGLVATLPGLAHLRLALRGDVVGGDAYDPFACRLVVEALTTAGVEEVRAVLRFVPDQVEIAILPGDPALIPSPRGGTNAAGSARTLRVDAGRVETLAALTDELVAARTALTTLSQQATAGAGPGEVARQLAGEADRLSRLTDRLHHEVMALRMTPLGPLLRRFPRVARELAQGLARDVDLVVDDRGVEADKAIVEGLSEPLTHLVRNAVDHGVEPPSTREPPGRPRRGAIRFTAAVIGGGLALTLTDDGAGIDPDAIRRAVVSRGLMPEAAVSALSPAEVVDLIFLPGFSTARTVTDVSGRGVGMDAVRTAVHRLGGRIAVESRPGQGTTFRIELPLSLTLTRILLVTVGDEDWGIPLDAVQQTLRLPQAEIIPIRAGQAFNWRDRTAPLVSLASRVGGPAPPVAGDRPVLVVHAGDRIAGLAVDAIRTRTDVVVRPLDGLLAGLAGVSGTTVLGDGRVLMVLDPEVLVG